MLVDGEKYACDACVRGHRVSSCTHKDRKLNHVNKKGRPLTQCPHCRGLRKSRASHVKCECGEFGHSRNSSVESTSEAGCQCRNGKKCTCALKKEPLDPAASRHRGNTYGSDGSQGYAMGQARQNIDPRHMPQRSADHHRRPAPMPFQQTTPHYQHGSPQPSSQLMDARQYSNPIQPGSMAHRRRAQLPALRINNQTQLPDFSESVDQSTLNKALSPGNPARYSFHGGMSHNNVGQQSRFSNNDMTNQQPLHHWQGGNVAGSYDPRSHYLSRHPMTPSDVSVDYSHSSQLGLSMSSSGTPSEPGDMSGQAPEMISQPLPFRPLSTNQQAYMHNDMASKSEMGMHEWSTYPMASYAVSDPGEATSNWQSQMNLDFAFANPENDHIVDQDMNQYPMMTDDAVREWVVEPPLQMQDPNLAHYNNYPSYQPSMPQTTDRFPANPGWT